MKKFIIHFSLVFTLTVAPLFAIGIYGFNQPHKYQDTFYAGLVKKDERLTSIEGKKIVFLGGSSLSFGLRSELMSEALGYEVVDYGLYAPIGIKSMAELAKSTIKEGDIVIFAPEINKETYSTHMDYQMLFKSTEEHREILKRFNFDDKVNLFYNYFYFVSERQTIEANPVAPYDYASFDSYGDISSDKVTQNIMVSYYDTAQLVEPNVELLDKDFINYMNDYAKAMNKKGAIAYFTFSPTNELALVKENLEEFSKTLQKSLNFEVLSSVEELTYHQNYFYDTNYHLNYAGTIEHSKKLVSILAEKLGIEVDYSIFPVVPRPRAYYEPIEDDDNKEDEPPEEDVTPSVTPDSELYFLEQYQDGYYLTGISDELNNETVIWVPQAIDDKTIVGVRANAFKDRKNVVRIILPSTIQTLDNNIFTGCDSLKRIYLTNETAPMTVYNGLLDGCPSTTKIAILRSARTTYTTGYTWREYLDKFTLYNIEDLDEYKK